jgi:hypothetical protein
MSQIHRTWAQSKAYRLILLLAVIYVLLRLAVQTMILTGALKLPGTGENEYVWRDLPVYLEAARHLQLRQNLYLKEPQLYQYQYAPSFALAFIPFLKISPVLVPIIHTLFHILEYALLYICWSRIFRRLGLKRVKELLAWSLPVWLVFSAFWSDLGYLNVYTLTALLATLLIDAILSERLGWAVLWLAIILQIKPHWAFAMPVPLLLGRRRFFCKLGVLTIAAYIAVMGLTVLAVGPSYGWQQYTDYFRLLLSLLHQENLWRTLADGFLGYNHSIKQTVVYLLGISPATLRLATMVKVLLLAPLAAVGLRHLRRPNRHGDAGFSRIGLDFAFALYCGAFIWLDVVWELTLGIVVFPYLLASLDSHVARRLAYGVFLSYALLDIWRLAAFLLFGSSAIVPGPYFLLDPSIYIPLTMIVILVFYALLVQRLWAAVPARQLVKGR